MGRKRELTEKEASLFEMASNCNLKEVINHYHRLQRSRVASSNQSGAIRRLALEKARKELEEHEALNGVLSEEARSEYVDILYGRNDFFEVEVLDWLSDSYKDMELTTKKVIEMAIKEHPAWPWLEEIRGVGPIIGAEIISQIDIYRAPTCGNVWSYAGLRPNIVWGKGTPCPFNRDLKRICWLLGESFVKQHREEVESSYYGFSYKRRRAYEEMSNEKGLYRETAEKIVARRKDDKKFLAGDQYKDFYSKGMLPRSHIFARAKRHTVKLFLSHLHTVLYYLEFRSIPKLPYPFVMQAQDHETYWAPPRAEVIPGLMSALEASVKAHICDIRNSASSQVKAYQDE